MTPFVAVVGAGPAGLAAAAQAARFGAHVAVYDEQPTPGGQLRYRVRAVAPQPGSSPVRPHELAERLLGEALSAGVEMQGGAVVAGLFSPRELLVVREGEATRLRCDAVVLATGSTDLPFPFAGATLPGVFSARGLQVLLHVHRVRPGRRFAIVGGADYAAEVADDVLAAGGEVIWAGFTPAPFLRADGEGGVRELTVGQDQFQVDAIAIALGRQADTALAAMAGAPLGFAAGMGGVVPILNDRLECPVPGLFVAGDAAGEASVAAAIAEGRLAGAAAAASVGLAIDGAVAELRASGGSELAWRQAVRASRQVAATQPYEPDGTT